MPSSVSSNTLAPGWAMSMGEWVAMMNWEPSFARRSMTSIKRITFLGDSAAQYVTYTCVRGESHYKGYAIIALKGSSLYVFHFRCAETDYERMSTVMMRIRDSISLGG